MHAEIVERHFHRGRPYFGRGQRAQRLVHRVPVGVADPHHDGQIGRVAIGPGVAVVVGGPRLGCRRPQRRLRVVALVEHQRRVRAVRKQLGRRVRQDVVDHVRRAWIDYLLALRNLVILEHAAFGVDDPRDRYQRDLETVVGKGRIDLGHVDRLDLGATQGQAQAERLFGVRPPGGYTHLGAHTNGVVDADEVEGLDRGNVQRVAQCAANGRLAVKDVVEVARAPLMGRRVFPTRRLIVHGRCRRLALHERRGVDHRLDG